MVSTQTKITRLVKKQENVTYSQEKKQSVETVSKMGQMSDLADKDFKEVIINMFKN